MVRARETEKKHMWPPPAVACKERRGGGEGRTACGRQEHRHPASTAPCLPGRAQPVVRALGILAPGKGGVLRLVLCRRSGGVALRVATRRHTGRRQGVGVHSHHSGMNSYGGVGDGLGRLGVVQLVVAVATKANNVDDSVGPPGRPPVGRQGAGKGNSVGVVGADVQNGGAGRPSQVGGVRAGARLRRRRGKPHLVVGDDVQRPPRRVTGHPGQRQGFRHYTQPRKRGVAVDEQARNRTVPQDGLLRAHLGGWWNGKEGGGGFRVGGSYHPRHATLPPPPPPLLSYASCPPAPTPCPARRAPPPPGGWGWGPPTRAGPGVAPRPAPGRRPAWRHGRGGT